MHERRFMLPLSTNVSPVDRPQKLRHTSCRYATGEAENPSRNTGPDGPEDAGGAGATARVRPGAANRADQRELDRAEPGDDLRVAAAASAEGMDLFGLGRFWK